MQVRILVACAGLVASSWAMAAGSARLEIPEFSHLQAKAVESVDVTVGPFMLWLATKVAPERDEDGTEVKKLLEGIEGVYIRSYRFDTDGAYSRDDIEKVRQQLQHAQWKPLVQVRNRQADNVDVFVSIENDKPTGFAIVASEPREFTIVNVVGTIDPQSIGKLQANLGLPGSKVRTASLDD
jgi:hypothetical protein